MEIIKTIDKKDSQSYGRLLDLLREIHKEDASTCEYFATKNDETFPQCKHPNANHNGTICIHYTCPFFVI